jgi:hypothetical protein
MCPSLLLRMPQLHHLQLSQSFIAMPALLAALRGMQQLQHLDLSVASSTPALAGAAMQQYAAFTASSQLTHLCIAAAIVELYVPMPLGAVQHMFPENKQLPLLKQLHLGVEEEEWHEASWYMKLFGPGDVALVAAACPALEQFWAIAAVQGHAQLADLTRLTSVTQLKIGGLDWGDAAAAVLSAAVAEMTQLQDLSVVGVIDFEAKHVAPLTRLTALRRLRVFGCNLWESTFASDELLVESKVWKLRCV